MVAQQAQAPKVARTRKPAPPVEIVPSNIREGIYGALSSRGDVWYSVNVAQLSCTCPAGERHFEHCKAGACKHLIAARVVARALASMSPAARERALRMTNIRVHVDKVDLARLDMPLYRPTAAALAA